VVVGGSPLPLGCDKPLGSLVSRCPAGCGSGSSALSIQYMCVHGLFDVDGSSLSGAISYGTMR
jgi:hypothetical protein